MLCFILPETSRDGSKLNMPCPKAMLQHFTLVKESWHGMLKKKADVSYKRQCAYTLPPLLYYFLHTLHSVSASKATIVTKTTTPDNGILSNSHDDWSVVPVSRKQLEISQKGTKHAEMTVNSVTAVKMAVYGIVLLQPWVLPVVLNRSPRVCCAYK